MQTETFKDYERRISRAAKKFKLTPRETQTLALLSQGHPWKAVACEMGVTISTVKFHVKNLTLKISGSNAFACLAKIFLP